MKQITKLDDSSFSDSDEVERKEESLLIITMRCKFVKKLFRFRSPRSMQDPVYEMLSKKIEELHSRLKSHRPPPTFAIKLEYWHNEHCNYHETNTEFSAPYK